MPKRKAVDSAVSRKQSRRCPRAMSEVSPSNAIQNAECFGRPVSTASRRDGKGNQFFLHNEPTDDPNQYEFDDDPIDDGGKEIDEAILNNSVSDDPVIPCPAQSPGLFELGIACGLASSDSGLGTGSAPTSLVSQVNVGHRDTFGNSSVSTDESVEGDDDVSDEEENLTGRGKTRPRVNGVPTKVKLSIKKSYVKSGELGGGLINETVLKSFREHVAHAIWVGHETKKVIKLQYHHRKFKQWKFENECERFKTLYLSLSGESDR